MSLRQTSPFNQVPEPVLSPSKEPQGSLSPDSENKQNADAGNEDHSTHSSNSSQTEKNNSDKKIAPKRKLNPPVVRQKLTKRERSNSSPVIHRSLPSSSNPISFQAEIGSSPRLQSKQSDATKKFLTPQQQLASDLADLMEEVLLRHKGRLHDPFDTSKATLNLQHQFDTKQGKKVFIHEVMLTIFSVDFKATSAWPIVQGIIKRIRVNYLNAKDFSTSRDYSGGIEPEKKNEASNMLSLFCKSFAGVFFNSSGTELTTSLPESLRFFLREIDYRQIRILLSDDKGLAISPDDFIRLRREWLAKVLIDAFLVPLVQKEFFSAPRNLATDNVVSHMIAALHSAFAISAPAILSESLKSAPEDVLNLLKKRRAMQFKPRINHQAKSIPHDQHADQKSDQKAQKKTISPSQLVLGAPTSPSRQRRTELRKLLKNLTTELANEKTQLTPDMLDKIKSFNNEFALSNKPISKASIYPAWLLILGTKEGEKDGIENLNGMEDKVNVLAVFKHIVDDAIDLDVGQAELENDLLEIDLLTKITSIEKSGQSLVIERAKRLSSNMPLNPISVSTSTSYLSPSPFSPNGFATSSVSSPSSTINSQNSPTTERLQQHRRVRTADAMPMKFHAESESLSDKERSALIVAFPDLILELIQRVAYRKVDNKLVLKSNPISAITEASRATFKIMLEKIPKVLREKVQNINSLPFDAETISHADLLKILMLDEFRQSAAGKALLSTRRQALQAAGQSQSNTPISEQASRKAEKERLLKIFQPHTEQLTSKLFSTDLSQSGFPPSLLALWKSFDNKLVDWAKANLNASVDKTDQLRSALGFDLLVTRLLYPMCIGIGDAEPTLAATSFADSVRLLTLKNWDTFFTAFKQT